MARRRRPKARRRRATKPRHAPRPDARKPSGHRRRPAKKARRSRIRSVAPPPPPAAAIDPRAEAARLGAALAGESDVARGLERLLTAARRITGAEAGTVYLRRGDVLEFAAVQNDLLARRVGETEVRRQVAARSLSLRENSIASYVLLTRATVNLRDAYEVPVDRPYTLFREVDRKADYRTRSMLAMPLRDGKGQVFGVLQLINALDGAGVVRSFTKEDQGLVEALAAEVIRLPGLTTS